MPNNCSKRLLNVVRTVNKVANVEDSVVNAENTTTVAATTTAVAAAVMAVTRTATIADRCTWDEQSFFFFEFLNELVNFIFI